MSLIPLTTSVEEDVLKRINYSRKQLAMDLEYLKTWLGSQEHLPDTKYLENDNFFISYLVGCKGSLETTKRKLDAYYSARSRNIEIFSTLDPLKPSIMKCRHYLDAFTIPETLPDGSRICIFRTTDSNVDIYDFLSTIQVLFLMMEHKLRMEGISGGDHYVLDAGTGYTPAHVLRINASIMRDVLSYLENVLPWRFHSLIFINAPSYVDLAVNTFFRPFMKKKLRERIIVSEEGAPVLQKMFPKKILPKDYGGDGPSCKELTDQWMDKIEGDREWYLKNCTQKTDESKRIETDGTSSNSLFGVHGSLKRLCVD